MSLKIEFKFSSPKIHASISRNARIYEKKYHFQQKADFSEKKEFLKEDGIFEKKNIFFLLAFSDIKQNLRVIATCLQGSIFGRKIKC